MPQFSYTVKGITETKRSKKFIEDELREAVEEATDTGRPFEVQEIIVDIVSDDD